MSLCRHQRMRSPRLLEQEQNTRTHGIAAQPSPPRFRLLDSHATKRQSCSSAQLFLEGPDDGCGVHPRNSLVRSHPTCVQSTARRASRASGAATQHAANWVRVTSCPTVAVCMYMCCPVSRSAHAPPSQNHGERCCATPTPPFCFHCDCVSRQHRI